MDQDRQVTTAEPQSSELMTFSIGARTPAQLSVEIERMKEMQARWQRFLADVLIENKDYGSLTGEKGGPIGLKKSGGEKLLKWHNFYAESIVTDTKEDWSLGLFAYITKATIRQIGTGVIVGYGEAECNSWEPKYRYRWVSAENIPAGVDPSALPKRERRGAGGSTYFQYRVENPDPAGVRNTVLQMAHKRAKVQGAITATGLRSFVEALDDDDDGGNSGDSGGEPSQNNASTGKDYGHPISEPQGRRLYAIRKGAKIDDDQFNKWLKAKYGWDSDREIGYKAYDEICKACESGKLEMPAASAAEQTSPEQPAAQPAAQPGAPITAEQIKTVWTSIHEAKSSEDEFVNWLRANYKQYGNKGINQILSSEFDAVHDAFRKWKKLP